MKPKDIVKIALSVVLSGMAGVLAAAGAYVSFWLWIPAAICAIGTRSLKTDKFRA